MNVAIAGIAESFVWGDKPKAPIYSPFDLVRHCLDKSGRQIVVPVDLEDSVSHWYQWGASKGIAFEDVPEYEVGDVLLWWEVAGCQDGFLAVVVKTFPLVVFVAATERVDATYTVVHSPILPIWEPDAVLRLESGDML